MERKIKNDRWMHSEYEKYYGKPKAETCVKDEKWTAGEERSSKKRKRNEVSRIEKMKDIDIR
jgi:hypothetical protein